MKNSVMADNEALIMVNTINFNKVLEVGDPVSQAKIFQSQSADELIFLNLDSKFNNYERVLTTIKKVSEEVFMPISVGGGIDNLDYIKELLSCGADKVSINTAFFNNSKIITDASNYFGSQCIVVSIDYAKNSLGKNVVVINDGNEMTDIDPVIWAQKAEKLGAGEILLTSIDNDGLGRGLDLEMISAMTNSVSLPIIASGGCGMAKHISDGFLIGGADAIAAGNFFSYKDQNQIQTRAQLSNSGVLVR